MKRRSPKRGATLVEAMCAVFVLGVATTAAVQMVVTIGVQRRLADRRSLAAEEAANLMEEIFTMPWSEITNENLANLPLSETLKKQGGDPVLSVSSRPHSEAPDSKEIRISIDWSDPGGGRSKPIQLIAWRVWTMEASE